MTVLIFQGDSFAALGLADLGTPLSVDRDQKQLEIDGMEEP